MAMRPSLFIPETNPFSLRVRTARVLSRTFPYEVPSQRVVAEQPSRPGEMELGQAFIVQWPVIRVSSNSTLYVCRKILMLYSP